MTRSLPTRTLRRPSNSAFSALPWVGSSSIVSSVALTFLLSSGWRCRSKVRTASGARSFRDGAAILRARRTPGREQLLERVQPLGLGKTAETSSDLLHQLSVRSNRHGLLPALGLIRADQHGSRLAIPRDDDLLIPRMDLIDEPAQLRFDLGQRECLHGSGPPVG